MLRRANGIALLDDLRERVELGNGIVASPSPGPGVLDGEDSPTNPQVPLLHLPSPVIEYRVQLVSKSVSVRVCPSTWFAQPSYNTSSTLMDCMYCTLNFSRRVSMSSLTLWISWV